MSRLLKDHGENVDKMADQLHGNDKYITEKPKK